MLTLTARCRSTSFINAVGDPHIGAMPPNLSDEDITDLAKLIKRAIDASRYPFSSEVSRWKELLGKLRPEPVREPLPPPTPKRYEPPCGRYQRRG